MRKEEKVEKYFCDVCGKELTEETSGTFFVTAHTNGEVSYEYSQPELCKEDSKALSDLFGALMTQFNLKDRYDKERLSAEDLLEFLKDNVMVL